MKSMLEVLDSIEDGVIHHVIEQLIIDHFGANNDRCPKYKEDLTFCSQKCSLVTETREICYLKNTVINVKKVIGW